MRCIVAAIAVVALHGLAAAETPATDFTKAAKSARSVEVWIGPKNPRFSVAPSDLDREAPNIVINCGLYCDRAVSGLLPLFDVETKIDEGCESLAHYVRIKLRSSSRKILADLTVSNVEPSTFYLSGVCYRSRNNLQPPPDQALDGLFQFQQ